VLCAQLGGGLERQQPQQQRGDQGLHPAATVPKRCCCQQTLSGASGEAGRFLKRWARECWDLRGFGHTSRRAAAGSPLFRTAPTAGEEDVGLRKRCYCTKGVRHVAVDLLSTACVMLHTCSARAAEPRAYAFKGCAALKGTCGGHKGTRVSRWAAVGVTRGTRNSEGLQRVRSAKRHLGSVVKHRLLRALQLRRCGLLSEDRNMAGEMAT